MSTSYRRIIKYLAIGRSKKRVGNDAVCARSASSSLQSSINSTEQDVCLTVDTPRSDVKSVHDLPGPTPLPVIGNFLSYLLPKNTHQIHQLMRRRFLRYGGIFKEYIGKDIQVHIADPDLIAQVYRRQGKYPIRKAIGCWYEHRRVSGRRKGLLTLEGEEWDEIRRFLNKRLLDHDHVASLTVHLNAVTSDLMSHLKYLRDKRGDEFLMSALPNEFYKWGMESICQILFDKRMGTLLNDSVTPEVQKLIDSIATMMSTSILLIYGFGVQRRLNSPIWKTHYQSWESLFDITKHHIDEGLEKIRLAHQRSLHTDVPQDGGGCGFLAHLLASCSLEDIYAYVAELMLGGIDTTSNTLCFALHLLSQYPDVQTKLRQEVDQVIGDGPATYEAIKQMKYIKWVVRETMRIHPVITMNTRMLEEDIILKGHRIPEQTLLILNHFTAGVDQSYFPEPEKFIPERWDRNTFTRPHPFAVQPFGFGTRACIGRRVAELELYLALIQITQTFRILPVHGVELEPKLRTTLTPGKHVPIRLVDK